MENEMKKVKKGKVGPVVLFLIGLTGICIIGYTMFLTISIGNKLSGTSIFALLVFLFIVFCSFVSFNFSLEYDEKHFVYKKSKNAEAQEVDFSDIEKIQHYSYRSGKNKTNEYKVFLKSTAEEVVLPYRQIDNGESYKEFLSQIIKTNPDVKFTELRSGLLGSKEEKELPFENFIL